jgi:hypothetical protein
MNAKWVEIVIMLLCLGLVGGTAGYKDETIEGNNEATETRTKYDNNLENKKVEKKTGQHELESSEYMKESFIIDIGDGKHSFKVIMEARPFGESEESEVYDSILNISIYDINDLSLPVQIINRETNGSIFKDYEVVDANFDGYMDFYYVDNRGNANYYCNFWIWNPESERFMISSDFGEISMPQFDNDLKVVGGYWRGSAVSNETRYYRYINGKLTCIRYMEMGYPDSEGMQALLVEDYIDGKLVEVFREKTLLTTSFSDKVYDSFFLWLDLEYHGE